MAAGKMRIVGLTAAALTLMLGAAAVFANSSLGGRTLAGLIARAASAPGSEVAIGGIDNLLSSEPVVRDVTIADDAGVWLKLDRATMRWRQRALLRGAVDIEALDAGAVEILRKPLTPPEAQPDKRSLFEMAQAALAWRPPLPVRVGALAVRRIDLAKPVLDAPAAIAIEGNADLGATGASARAALAIKRLDAPGTIAATIDVAADGQRIALSVDASEPAGGLVARLASLPNLPPVEVHLKGDGPLDNFAARLDARAGGAADAVGDLSIIRDGARRRASLDLAAHIAALLPRDAAALFEDQTKVKAVGWFGDDKAVALDAIELSTSAFRLTGDAKLAPDGGLAGQFAAVGATPRPNASFAAARLEARAKISGSLTEPEGALRLLVEDASAPVGRIGHLDMDASVARDVGAAASGFTVRANARASGLTLADAALARAVGDSAKFDFLAHASNLDSMNVSAASLESGAGRLTFTGQAGPRKIDGRAQLSIPELNQFSSLAKRDLRGALTLAVAIAGSPREGRVSAVLDGGVKDPRLGVPALDGLLGGKASVKGVVATDDGGVRFDRLSIAGAHVDALLDGKATNDLANLKIAVDAPDLAKADARLKGRAHADIALAGALKKLDATFAARVQDAAAIGRPIPHLALTGAARDVTGATAVSASIEGIIDGKPARGALRANRAGQNWSLDTLDLSVGKAQAAGALILDKDMRARGRVRIAAPDLDDLSAFALQKLSGRLDADVTFENDSGGQTIRVEAHGAGLRAADATLDRLDAQISARDVYRRPALEGQAAADGLRVAGQAISRARLLAKPDANGATALDLSIAARDYELTARGTLNASDPLRLDIAQFSANRAGRRFALARPASVILRDGGADVKGVTIAAGSGSLSIDGLVGPRLALNINARALPLSLVAILDPKLALDGLADAEAKIEGDAASPSGDWRVKVSRLTAPQTRSAGLPPTDIAARGHVQGDRTTLDASVAIGAKSRLTLAGTAPLGAGALDLAIKGTIDAALANPTLSVNGQSVAGKAVVDLRVSGPIAAPLVGGAVDVVDGAFADPLNGVALTKIVGRLVGKGREVDIVGLSAQTKNGGRINVVGRATADFAAGMPGSLIVKSTNAQFVDSDIASATGDLDLVISGPLLRAPRTSGRVTLRTMDVNVPDRLPVDLKPLPGSRHIDAKGFAAQMLAVERKEKARAAHRTAFDAMIDLKIAAPNRIFVRGRGIDAEFGGELKVSGSIQKPIVDGGFDLRRGRMQLLTQRIDITQGKLTFAGGLVPQLDFSAQTTASGVTAKIGVTGPASLPTFTFTSTPELPQDEVLSRLLFAKASGSLTPFQAVQLAMALAQFSGVSAGADAFEKMRRALGVDSLDLDLGGANGPSVGVSRYIMNGVSVGVRTGTKPDQTSVNVGFDVFKNFRVQSETRVDGKTSVGVGVEWEY